MIIDGLYMRLKALIAALRDTILPRIETVETDITALGVDVAAVKNEILNNKTLMYLQAAQISPNTYLTNKKRFLEFINIKECRDLYVNDYSQFNSKLLNPAAVTFKVAGTLLNLACETSMFSDVDGKISDNSNNYSNPNYYEKYMYNTVAKIKKLYAFHKKFIDERKLPDLHYISPLVVKRYTSKKLTASNSSEATLTYSGKGLFLGCFSQRSSDTSTWNNFQEVRTPGNQGTSSNPVVIKSISVDGATPQPIPHIGYNYEVSNSMEFNSSIQVTFSGSDYSENVYGGIAIMPY